MSEFIFSILLLAALSGCATPARVDQMTAKRIDASKITNESPLRNNLSLKGVSGGESTNPLWLSKVGSDDFRQALEQSLKTVMLLATDQSNGGYLLNATLVSLEQPWVGLDLQVVATVEYSLGNERLEKSFFQGRLRRHLRRVFPMRCLHSNCSKSQMRGP